MSVDDPSRKSGDVRHDFIYVAFWDDQRTLKFRRGQRVRVRYQDGAWYPAIILEQTKDGRWLVRWDPPDPSIPATYPAEEEDMQ
jgi:hypothetical protein